MEGEDTFEQPRAPFFRRRKLTTYHKRMYAQFEDEAAEAPATHCLFARPTLNHAFNEVVDHGFQGPKQALIRSIKLKEAEIRNLND